MPGRVGRSRRPARRPLPRRVGRRGAASRTSSPVSASSPRTSRRRRSCGSRAGCATCSPDAFGAYLRQHGRQPRPLALPPRRRAAAATPTASRPKPCSANVASEARPVPTTRRRLWAALQALPARQREAIVCRFYLDMSEAADRRRARRAGRNREVGDVARARDVARRAGIGAAVTMDDFESELRRTLRRPRRRRCPTRTTRRRKSVARVRRRRAVKQRRVRAADRAGRRRGSVAAVAGVAGRDDSKRDRVTTCPVDDDRRPNATRHRTTAVGAGGRTADVPGSGTDARYAGAAGHRAPSSRRRRSGDVSAVWRRTRGRPTRATSSSVRRTGRVSTQFARMATTASVVYPSAATPGRVPSPTTRRSRSRTVTWSVGRLPVSPRADCVAIIADYIACVALGLSARVLAGGTVRG